MIVDSGKYFLYRHIRLDKNEPFYIGVATEAEKEIGCKRTNICNCLKNRAPSSCGYIWKYKNI